MDEDRDNEAFSAARASSSKEARAHCSVTSSSTVHRNAGRIENGREGERARESSAPMSHFIWDLPRQHSIRSHAHPHFLRCWVCATPGRALQTRLGSSRSLQGGRAAATRR